MSADAVVVVAGKAGTFHFCGPHTGDAMKKALLITGTERECHLHFPPVGDIVLRCDNPVGMAGVPQEAATGAPGPGTAG